MSELINNRDSSTTIRWKLLTSASALVLVSSMSVARAEDADHPLIWLELGGQMENVSGQGDVFAPPFLAANPTSPVLLESVTPFQAQKPSKFGFGEEGKISFQPDGSDWVFSAAIRYGRSSNARHVQHQTDAYHYKYQTNGVPRPGVGNIITRADFVDTHARRTEDHAILDFTAGKDVGLGIFGKDASSTLNFGVRFAQFTSKAGFDIRARPNFQEKYVTGTVTNGIETIAVSHFNTYHATGHASRNFKGLGPSLSWTGSAPFVGNEQDGELTFDWDANAAILFGKQKARVQHRETAHHFDKTYNIFSGIGYTTLYTPQVGGHSTNRSVTVPNVGGSVGLSWRVQDFKVSMGYRADFFFGAMDTGIDVAKKSNATFNGPYASISIGLGN